MADAVTVSTSAGHSTTAQLTGKHSTVNDEEMHAGQEQSDGPPTVLEVADDPELVDANPRDMTTSILLKMEADVKTNNATKSN